MPLSASDLPALERLRAFAASLRSTADRLDRDGAFLHDRYLAFQAAGLNAFGSPRMPLGPVGMIEALAALAEESGAFAFVALQQYVANLSYPDSDEDPWPRLGVAFGHLRNPHGPAPLWRDGGVTGAIPWLTGARTLDRVLLGVRLEGGREAYAWTDGRDRPEFRHSPPMDLIACTGTRTVAVQVERLRLSRIEMIRVDEPGSLASGDAMGVLFQTPLMIGALRASLRLIEACPRVEPDLRARCAERVESLIGQVFDALAAGTAAERGPDLRARLGDLSTRLARLAAMACGGRALQAGHPAERLYREALVYSLMAQTDRIVNDAFEGVFQ